VGNGDVAGTGALPHQIGKPSARDLLSPVAVRPQRHFSFWGVSSVFVARSAQGNGFLVAEAMLFALFLCLFPTA
jgi:hypothetical protein